MTFEEYIEGCITVFDNIKQNEEILKELDKDQREEFINIFENGEKQLKEISSGSEDDVIQINVYTTGLKQTIVKVEIVIMDKDEKEYGTIAIIPINDEELTFELTVEETEALIGSIKTDDDKSIELELEIEKLGTFELVLEVNEEYNVEIDEVDKDKTISMDDLTEQEQKTILQNLQNSKLYELIEQFSNNSSNIDDEYIQNNTTSSLKDNQILTYDGKTIVQFGIPTGYNIDRISDNYQTLSKDEVSINIKSDMIFGTDYYESLKELNDNLLQQNNYKNVTLNKENLTVNGINFDHATRSYTSDYGNGYEYTTSIDYIWTKVSDDYIFEFQIIGFEKMTQDEVEQLLTLAINNVQ